MNIMNKASSKIQILLIILFSATLSLIVLNLANPLYFAPGRDGGAYMFGGRTIFSGKTLYIDYWEAKGPVIFFINALGLLVGNNSRWGIWFIEFLFWFFSALLGSLTIKKHYGLLSAIFGVTIMMMAGKILVGSGNFTEEYSHLFTWISLFAFSQLLTKPDSRVYPIIMGAMVAANFFVRANNSVTSGVLILIWVFHIYRTNGFKKGLYQLTLVIVGGLLVVIPIIIYFSITGALGEMIIASIIYNYSYSFSTRPSYRNLNIYISGFMPALSSLGIWMVIPMIGWLFALIQFIRQIINKHYDVWTLLLVIIWPLEMLASSISGRNYAHYFLCWLPIMAIVSSFAITYIDKTILPPEFLSFVHKIMPTLGLGVTIIVISVIYNQDLARYGSSFNRLIFHPNEGVEYIDPISKFVAENTDAEDLVLVWGGQTGINFMSNRNSPTAYNFYPLYANSKIGREIQEEYFNDLMENKPKLIVDAHMHAPDQLPVLSPDLRHQERILFPISQTYPQVREYIVENYDLIYDEGGYQVFQIHETIEGN